MRLSLFCLFLFFSASPSHAEQILSKQAGDEKLGPDVQAALSPSSPGTQNKGVTEGEIQIYVRYSADSQVESINAALQAAGLRIELVNEELRTVQGWIADERVIALAEEPFVEKVTRAKIGRPKAGSVASEGDAIIEADAVRELGFTGAGIKVGVISDGIDNVSSAQQTLDLPQNVATVGTPGIGDEGTAMLEIIHDIAPGATLGFCGASTSLEFIACIETLRTDFGADLIVEDLGFPLEPYFEDGPVAATSESAAREILFISAAGNDALRHYQASFEGTAELGLVDDQGATLQEHNFGLASGERSDPVLDILVPAGEIVEVVLQWNDPFGKSNNDYDLLLVNSAGAIVAASTAEQNGNDDPIEGVFFENLAGDALPLGIVVVNFRGEPRVLEFFVQDALLKEHIVSEDSVWGQSAAESVMAVGAISASDPGADEIAAYSSRGPTLISFPAKVVRQKPDIVAIDGVQVSGAGNFDSPFFGTSAAAPHVAGVAALLLEAFPALTAERLKSLMAESAVDLGAEGVDNIFGAGRLDALRAFNVASGLPVAEPATDDSAGDDGGGGGCFIATAAYGSRLHPHVETLREFRDRHLLPTSIGREFVGWYYRISPPLAEEIRQRPWLREVVRAALAPVVYAIAYPLAAFALLSIAAGGFAMRRRVLTSLR